MKLARVVGHVVLSRAIDPYADKTLHVTCDLDQQLEPVGESEVSVAWQAMETGDLVVVEVAREACNAFEPPIPADAAIIGRVDRVHIERRANTGSRDGG